MEPEAGKSQLEALLQSLPSDPAGVTLTGGLRTGRAEENADSSAVDRTVREALRSGVRAADGEKEKTGPIPNPKPNPDTSPGDEQTSMDDVLAAVHTAMAELREQQARQEVHLLKKIQTQVSEQLATERRVADATIVGRLVGMALADTGVENELSSLQQAVLDQQAQIASLEAKLHLVLEKGTRRDSRSPVPRGVRDRRKTSMRRDECAGAHCPTCEQRALLDSTHSDDSGRRVNQWLLDHYKRQAARPPSGVPPLNGDWKDASVQEEIDTANPPSALGPRAAGLVEIQPSEPLFQKAVSYRRYRLIRTNPDISDAVLAKTGDHYKKLKHVLGSSKFDGRDPISVIPFLSAYKKQCDRNNVAEGAALVLLPNFLKGEAKESFEANFELGEVGGGGFHTYPGAVQYLLHMYATDANIERVVEELDAMRQREDETELRPSSPNASARRRDPADRFTLRPTSSHVSYGEFPLT